ncbi:hypothetical protein BDZ89DRAFT_1059759 [Hymenopellis radicata]|nr:hypothetical protein BDZ89DRAFT_1059759 [Hymenopellis radicata]
MAPRTCALCHTARAMLKRPKTGKSAKTAFCSSEHVAVVVRKRMLVSMRGPVFKNHHCPEARDSQVAFKPSTAVVLCNA